MAEMSQYFRVPLICVFVVFSAFYKSSDSVQFPPVVVDSTGAEPRGHLRPFGHQREPDAKIVEYERGIHPKDFWENHVSKSRPLVFRGGAIGSLGVKLWSDEYLNRTYGDLDVIIERKVERRPQIKMRMTFSKFLENYEERSWYVVSLLPDEMRHEVEAQQCLMCGNFQKNLQELNFWMSSGGTASIIHFDADHNIHCLLAGRKDFIMIDPVYNEYLNLYKPEEAGSAYTSINVDAVDMVKFPEIRKVQWTWTTLLPGDCIFIPGKYVHQVRSYGRSISTTTLFTTHGVYNDTDCEGFSPKYATMADMDIFWTYHKGQKTVDIGYGDVILFRQELLERAVGISKHSEFFENIYESFADGFDEIASRDELWNILDKHKRGFLTEKDILDLDDESLKTFFRKAVPPAGPLQEFIISDEIHEKYLQENDVESGILELKEEAKKREKSKLKMQTVSDDDSKDEL
ncbi:tRNA wybutosine-synthesizing protein 5-like [Saccoglossus kowalevskii]|uniref:Uncharacterized protein LOC100371259 n=1 Tax=Saccoglossus kowalevskii TaxID=10224 RepID=A0ABM0GP97_SACKO|nr:PREDICTED: uncharacterized protein LOC100371259 [Saccoglossus kowalevskii]